MNIRLKALSKIIIALYAVTIVFWIFLVVIAQYNLVNTDLLTSIRRFTQWPLVFIPLAGGIFGLKNSIQWGGYKSIVGKALIGISLGLLAWSGGMVIWNYYLFFTNIQVPYPSWADAVFVLSWPLWTYGILKLSKAIGVNFALRSRSNKLFLIVIPLVIILISIYLLIYVARGGIVYDGGLLKLFFDLFYPLGDVVILSITTVVYFLSKKYLGGIYKIPTLLLLLGFLMNYFSDFMFSYTTTKGTYFNGHLVDFLFTTTMFILSLSVSMFSPRVLEETQKI